MSAPKDANKKHHFNPTEPEEKLQFFRNLVEQKIPVAIWAKGQSEKDLEEYTPTRVDLNTHTLYLKAEGGFLSKLTKSKLLEQEVFFRAIIGKLQYFTYSHLGYNDESGEYFLKLSQDIFRGQQRSNYRLNTSRYVVVKLRMGTNLYNCLDISAGGTSFIIKSTELAKYPLGLEIEDNKIQFQRQAFDIPLCKVAGHWPIKDIEGKPTGETKIGISFHDIPKNAEEELFKEINSEARLEEMRKRFKN